MPAHDHSETRIVSAPCWQSAIAAFHSLSLQLEFSFGGPFTAPLRESLPWKDYKASMHVFHQQAYQQTQRPRTTARVETRISRSLAWGSSSEANNSNVCFPERESSVPIESNGSAFFIICADLEVPDRRHGITRTDRPTAHRSQAAESVPVLPQDRTSFESAIPKHEEGVRGSGMPVRQDRFSNSLMNR